MSNQNEKLQTIPVNELHKHPKLKDPDTELLEFFKEMYSVNLNSEFSTFVFKHGMSYLDALCSIRFDICPRNDRRHIVKIMEMVINKTNELMDEAKRGL